VRNLSGVPNEALQNFGDHDAGEGERLVCNNHATQLSTCRTRTGTKEINPNGAIDEDQTRFLRAALRLPDQIPLP